MESRTLRWSTNLAIALVCLAFFYAGDAVGRLRYELADPEQPQWVPIARVVVFGTGCWLAIGWLRDAIRRAGRPPSGNSRAAT